MILLFIVTVPFTAAWMSAYHHLQVTNILFDLNLFILGLLFVLSWLYATLGRKLVDGNIEEHIIRSGILRSLLTSTVSLIAISISFFHPSWSNYAYVLIPALAFLKPFRMR